MEKDLKLLGWKARSAPGLMNFIGPLWTRQENDSWGYGLLLEEHHCNPAGIVHGGIITTLADHALSTLAWEASGRQPCITIQLGTHFLLPVQPGTFLEARGCIVQQGRSLFFMEGRLSVEDRDVALVNGVWKKA